MTTVSRITVRSGPPAQSMTVPPAPVAVDAELQALLRAAERLVDLHPQYRLDIELSSTEG